MGDVVLSLLPLMLSAALAPVPLVIVFLLLRGQGGLATAAAFVAGTTVVRLAQGALFGFLLADAPGSGGGEGPGPVAATLLLVLGILLWVTAVRTLLKEEDSDAPPPAWMARLREATPLAAFAVGAGLIAVATKQWVFTLSALGMIAQASLDSGYAALAYLIFMIGA